MNTRDNSTTSLFAPSHEKGRKEWSTFSLTKHDRTPGSYRVSLPRIIHLKIRPAAPHYQELFILKNAH